MLINQLSEIQFITIIDHLGTFAFAISGIKLAGEKKFDWFGAYVVGLVTAIGGGTTRDLLLGVSPFWMQNPSYLITTGVALVIYLIFNRPLLKLNKTLFLFDTIGLGLFTIVGLEKTLLNDFPFWVAIILGMVTGSVGGVIRDILLNEVPLILKRDIYALACILGGIVYWLCTLAALPSLLTITFAASAVIIIRILAVTYHLQIPRLKR